MIYSSPKMKRAATFLLLAVTCTSLSAAGASITYNVNLMIGTGTVTGTITTDGTVGVLAQANIVGYNLQLSEDTRTFHLSCCNFFPFTGSDLSATATQLLFNFSGTDNGAVVFADASDDFDVCFSTFAFGPGSSFCEGAGETLTFTTIACCGLQFMFTSQSGTQAIATTASLDQSNVSDPTNYGGLNDALDWQQQVTAGSGGVLAGVKLFTFGSSDTLTVSIGLGSTGQGFPGNGSFFAGPFAFTTRTTITQSGTFIDTSAANILLKPGQQFVIDVSGGSGQTGGVNYMLASLSTPYAGGGLFFAEGFNAFGNSMAFQTFVTGTVSSQTIAFGALGNVTLGVSPFPIGATATSGLAVTFTSTTAAVCTVSGNIVTIIALGTCSITASQPGSTNYTAATPVTQHFTINPAGVTLGSTGQVALFSALGTSTGGTYPSIPVSFTVTPCPACSGTWTASSNAPWVIVASGGSGTGVGSVSFNVLANTLLTSRSATIAMTMTGVAPVSVTVNEAGSTQSMLNRETLALYQRSLGREPDSGGFNFWTCITPATVTPCANLGEAGLGQMVDLFLQSQEGVSTDFQVLAIYRAILGRLPAFAEWSSAVAPFRVNDTPAGWISAAAALVNAMLNSPEYAGRYGSPGNTGNVVANLYQNALNRQPASGELTSGITTVGNSGLLSLFTTIFTGAEFRSTGAFASTSAAADHSNNLFVTMIYYAVLARDPDPSGYAFWMGIANGGGAGIYFQPTGSTGANTRLLIEGPGAPNVGLVGSVEFQSLFAN